MVVVALKCKQTIASYCVIKPHWDDSILYNDSKSKAESDFLSSYFASVFTCDDEYNLYFYNDMVIFTPNDIHMQLIHFHAE